MLKYNGKLGDRAKELRTNSTLAEVLLWNELKLRKLGVRFVRQKMIDQFIVDFYCKEMKLAIEVDGLIHNDQTESDLERQNKLESLGVTFIRFSNEAILKKMKEVIIQIMDLIPSIGGVDANGRRGGL